MHIVHYIRELRAEVRVWRERRETVGLVPTMGNLHAGHLALVEEARARCDRVVVSVFVNPTQFTPGEDYETYPRSLDRDCAVLEPMGVDSVFAPPVEEVYPDGPGARTRVELPELTGILCGATRPGHFTGVATVVAKLFNIVQPDVAVFGRKDFQQFIVIRRMVRDLDVPVEIVGSPTVREADGLAMSSRNWYLSARERPLATAINRMLRRVAQRLEAGERDIAALETEGRRELEAAGLRPDYVAVRRRDDLGSPTAGDRALVVLAAAYLGRTRLIDNIELTLNGEGEGG